jgi:type II secretory pathway component PulF
MNLAYKYQARSERGKVIEGTIYAPNRAMAMSKLRKNGYSPIAVSFSLGATIGAIGGTAFNTAELGRLYATLGRRIKNGKPLIEGLEAASEYITDERLKQAIMIFRQGVQDGQNEFQAMMAAGFPKRDAMIIRSTAEAGRTGETFINLSAELARITGLKRAMKQIFFMPIAMGVFMYLFFYGAVTQISPMTIKFLGQTGMKIKMNAFNQAYFDFATFFNENLVLSSTIYFALPVGFFFFVKTGGMKRVMDHIPNIKRLAIKSDQAALWNSFSLLYDAAIPVREACAILSDASGREDSRIAFQKLGRLIDSGKPIDEAIQNCGFPPFVVSGVRSSSSSGDLVAGVNDMVRNLEEDVNTATEMLKENIKLFSILFVATGVMITFMVTYYPIVSSVLGNV